MAALPPVRRDAQREEMLKLLYGVRPVALDIFVCPDGRSVEVSIVALSVPPFRDDLSQWPLHQAVFVGDQPQLQLLLRSGHFDLNIPDRHGNTPLHLACQLGQLTTVELLLRYGAMASMPNAAGFTALGEAVSYANRSIIERVWFGHRRLLSCAVKARKEAVLNELYALLTIRRGCGLLSCTCARVNAQVSILASSCGGRCILEPCTDPRIAATFGSK